MTRVSDLPEHEWREHQARVRHALESVDEINARLAERAAQRQADGSDYTERRRREDDEWMQQQQRDREAQRQQQAPVMQRDWAAERKWIEGIIDQRVGKKLKTLDKELMALAEEAGGEAATLWRRIEALEDRATKAETATVELLLELERRIAGIEQQRSIPARPRLLIAGRSADDAA